MARVFIIYEHRLFSDILCNVLSEHNVVGTIGRPTIPLAAIVEAMNNAHPDVVILEAEANGNSAWHVLLAGGEARRVVVLDMERGVVRDYGVRRTAIDTLEELLLFIGPR